MRVLAQAVVYDGRPAWQWLLRCRACLTEFWAWSESQETPSAVAECPFCHSAPRVEALEFLPVHAVGPSVELLPTEKAGGGQP